MISIENEEVGPPHIAASTGDISPSDGSLCKHTATVLSHEGTTKVNYIDTRAEGTGLSLTGTPENDPHQTVGSRKEP